MAGAGLCLGGGGGEGGEGGEGGGEEGGEGGGEERGGRELDRKRQMLFHIQGMRQADLE